MLSPEYMGRVTDNLIELYQDLEDEIIEDIANRISKNGYLTATAQRQAEVLIQNGYTTSEIESLIEDRLEEIDGELNNIIDISAIKHYEDEQKAYRLANKEMVDYSKNRNVENTVNVARDRLIEGNGNITKSLGVVVNGEDILLNDFYRKTLNQAVFKVSSGAFSREQVVRGLVNDISNSGIKSINYMGSGRNYTLESASKMIVRTTLNQMTGEISMDNAKDMGQDLMEISAHAGARPSHAVWQGQVVSISGENSKYLSLDDIGYGEVTGFMGANCRHNWYPFFEGISEKEWTKEMLDDIDPEPFEFDGKEYTYYEATQKQRQIERAIRKYKHRVMMYERLGDDESRLIAQVRLQRQRQLYKDFNKAGNLRAKPYNLAKYGYNRSKASKEVWAAKKAQKKANEIYNLGSDKKNLDIYLKDRPLRKYIKENKDFDKLKVGKQENHLNNMENIKKKSQFKNTIEEIELVYKENRGSGEFIRRDKSQLTELIEDNRLDGYCINREGNVVTTMRAIIHYSKNGYHIVPTLREFKELRR
ncbi:hypothetical protein HV819_02180 [Anaerococcus sp. AGMB00486]|uniref:Bacterial toxin 50 domain-containing protein n=2 Tax=Anaerococcus TaxID=165779 RepID=A0ABX2N7Y9_9FIRM|nr:MULTISPECIES: phage minor capsid protein [Anaerococcus]MSS77392.1 hypothetical protein [Anaerococcus porci]NVF10807.1 hypothetical protein [Anaerococcus faecalis]